MSLFIYLFFSRTGVPVSRKMSDVRMPRIPSAQKNELLSPGSKSNSVSAGRAQSGKQDFTGKFIE